MCDLCPSGKLPHAQVHVSISWCDHYDSPSDLWGEAWVEDGSDEPTILLRRQHKIGPFDDESDVRRLVDALVMEGGRAISLWRQGT